MELRSPVTSRLLISTSVKLIKPKQKTGLNFDGIIRLVNTL